MQEEDLALGCAAVAKLPENIRFGTSTWTYPGWKGLVYHQSYKSDKQFKLDSLSEYCRCALFRSVGIDSSFYAPLKPTLLRHYAALVPPNFKWVSKVWEQLTIPSYPAHKRYGKHAGQTNPDFLNSDLFSDKVLEPLRDASVFPHCGPLVFQFPYIAKGTLSKEAFMEKLDNFLSRVPSDFRYAIELRNRDYLDTQYFEILNHRGASHCFNHWFSMPGLKTQMQAAADAGGLKADFYVVRILTPLGVSYENAVKLFEPYDQLKRPNPEMRDDVVRLVKRALQKNTETFIIVNNRCEGNAPLTIAAITRMITEANPTN